METKHTKGPWKFEQNGDSFTLWGSGRKERILSISSGVIPITQDQPLLEAAPDLLAALKRAIAELRIYENTPKSEILEKGYMHTMETVRASIAKAEGRAE